MCNHLCTTWSVRALSAEHGMNKHYWHHYAIHCKVAGYHEYSKGSNVMTLQYHLMQKAKTHSPMHPLIIACQQYIALHPTLEWRPFYFENAYCHR